MLFERVGGLYCFDASNTKVIANNTVNENKLKYTKRQVKKAEEAARVHRRLFIPSDEAIPHIDKVSHILTDNEGGIATLFPELERAGYGIYPADAGDS